MAFSIWNKTLYSDNNFPSVFISGTKAIAGSNDGIYYSNDTGSGFNSWTQVSGTSVGFPSVFISNDGTKAIAGSTNGIYYATNIGLTNWTQSSVTSGTFPSVFISNDGTKAIAGSTNGIWYSNNSGFTNWTQSSVTSGIFPSVFISNDGTKAIAGSTNGIYYATASGSGFNSWTQSSVTSGTFNSVFISNDGTKAIAGSTNGIYYATDSGFTNWNQASGTSGNTFYSVFISGTKAIAGSDSGIYYATDSGFTIWQKVSDTAGTFYSVFISNDGKKAIAGSNDGIYYATDTGSGFTSWNQASGTSGNTFYSVFISGTKAIAGSGANVDNDNGIWYSTLNFVCFKQDSKILTDKGYIQIQDLRPGHLVKTVSNGFKPIHSIGKRDIYHPASSERIKDQLYLCNKENYPDLFEDLVITGCHSILVPQFKDDAEREKTIEVNGNTYVTDGYYRLPACADEHTSVYSESGDYTIYHFALENNDYYTNYGVYANGLLVETCSKRYLNELSGMELLE